MSDEQRSVERILWLRRMQQFHRVHFCHGVAGSLLLMFPWGGCRCSVTQARLEQNCQWTVFRCVDYVLRGIDLVRRKFGRPVRVALPSVQNAKDGLDSQPTGVLQVRFAVQNRNRSHHFEGGWRGIGSSRVVVILKPIRLHSETANRRHSIAFAGHTMCRYFEIPGQQLADAVHRMIRNAQEHWLS